MDKRTDKQRRSLQKYCTELAKALNAAGLDMRAVLFGKVESRIMELVDEICPKEAYRFNDVFTRFGMAVDVSWGMESVKEQLWRTIQVAVTGKYSSTELTTKEVIEVFETLNRHIGDRHGVYVPWPCLETLSEAQRLKA